MDLSALKVLYLEDEPLIALDIADALETFGFRMVVTAHSLASAERHVKDEIFDLAVLDINLGGHQTSLKLGEELSNGGVKVLFASGNSAREADLLSEGYGYLMKPFGPTTLRHAIEQMFPENVALKNGAALG